MSQYWFTLSNNLRPAIFQACCQRPRLLNNSAFRYCDRSHQFTDDPTNGCSEYECFFLENKFFVHDEFQKNLLVTYLSDVAESNVDTNNRDFDWKGLIEDSYDTCIKRVEESEQELRQAYLDSYGINPTECNAKFVATMSCIYYQIFINCPGGAWDHCKSSSVAYNSHVTSLIRSL